jgi:hypothetical protein
MRRAMASQAVQELSATWCEIGYLEGGARVAALGAHRRREQKQTQTGCDGRGTYIWLSRRIHLVHT